MSDDEESRDGQPAAHPAAPKRAAEKQAAEEEDEASSEEDEADGGASGADPQKGRFCDGRRHFTTYDKDTDKPKDCRHDGHANWEARCLQLDLYPGPETLSVPAAAHAPCGGNSGKPCFEIVCVHPLHLLQLSNSEVFSVVNPKNPYNGFLFVWNASMAARGTGRVLGKW